MDEAKTDTSLFKEKTLEQGNFIQRTLGIVPKINALIELTNAMAKAKSIKSITIDTITALNENYHVNIYRKYSKKLEGIYEDYISHCLSDNQLSSEEVDAILHLKKVFGITDKRHNEIYEEVGKAVYKRCLKEVLADARISNEEKSLLDKLKRELELPEEVISNIYKTETSTFLEGKIEELTRDRKLSPDEEKELDEIAGSLGMEIPDDEATKAKLMRCRYFWRLENGEIPVIDADINLGRNEVCYFKGTVDWYETRKMTRRVLFGGPTLRVKIMNGFYYSFHDYSFLPISQDVLTHIDNGRLYLTNKRIIFSGKMKNVSIKLGNILDFTPFKDGVLIEKDSGKSPIMSFTKNLDIFIPLLARVLKDHYGE